MSPPSPSSPVSYTFTSTSTSTALIPPPPAPHPSPAHADPNNPPFSSPPTLYPPVLFSSADLLAAQDAVYPPLVPDQPACDACPAEKAPPHAPIRKRARMRGPRTTPPPAMTWTQAARAAFERLGGGREGFVCDMADIVHVVESDWHFFRGQGRMPKYWKANFRKVLREQHGVGGVRLEMMDEGEAGVGRGLGG